MKDKDFLNLLNLENKKTHSIIRMSFLVAHRGIEPRTP